MSWSENEVKSPFMYRDLDHRLRTRMLEMLQETVDRVAAHILFQLENGKHRPWKERTRLSLRFRLKGPLGGTFSDEWSRVTVYASEKGGKVKRHLKTVNTREGKKMRTSDVMTLARNWEREATSDILIYLHATRLEWASLAQARKALHEAAVTAGQPYEMLAIPQVRQRKIIDAVIAANPDEEPPTPPAAAAKPPSRRAPKAATPDTASNPVYEPLNKYRS